MTPRPSLLDAYLIAADSQGSPPVAAVRKDGHVWRILRFELPHESQPRDVFATREDAGRHLLDLAAAQD